MLVRKEVIRPGKYWYLDETTGMPRKLNATKEYVHYLFQQGQAMLSCGLSIPVPFEHQKTAKPLTQAERAAQQLLNNSGWVDHYEMDGDILFSVLDIADPAIAAKLPHTIKWTSPWLNSFIDGNGRAWNGVISHVALTTRPRITEQTPFPNVSAAMSFAAGLPLSANLGAQPVKELSVCLSRAGLLEGEGAATRPLFPMAFSLYTGVALAAEDMLEKPKKPPADKPAAAGDKPPVAPDAPAETPPDMPSPLSPMGMPPEEQLVDGDGDISVYTVLADLLHTVQIDLGEGITRENFAQKLYKAAMEKVKGMGGAATPGAEMNETPTTPTPKVEPPSPIVQETAPMYMSLERINAIADPEKKQMAMMLHSLHNNAIETARSERMKRIERLARRLPAPVKDKLLTQLATPGASLSMDTTGKVNDPLGVFLDMLEQTAIDVPALMTGPGAAMATEIDHPRDYSTTVPTNERIAKVREELCRNAGLPQAKAS